MDIEKMTKDEILSAIKTDKKGLLSAKQEKIKFTDSISFQPSVKKEGEVAVLFQNKDDSSSDRGLLGKDSIDVTIVCNTAWFCDSHMDVLTDKAYDSSVSKRGNKIPHIADHKQTSTSHVGDVTKVYTKQVSLRELGFDKEGYTTALLMDSTVRKDYNEDVFKFYSNGKINQHSIGLRYLDLAIAVNSKQKDYKEEFALWEEYYPNIINKEIVDERGYFWIVKDVDVMENSCVLFGANPLTPTLSMKSFSEDKKDISSEVILNNEIRGNTMDLQQLQAEVIKLSAENQTLKDSQSLETAKAVKVAEDRIFGIFDAAKTFGLSTDTAMKFAKTKSSLSDVVISFETIKETSQKETHVNTAGEGLTPGKTKDELEAEKTGEISGKNYFLKLSEKFTSSNTFGDLM